MCFAKRFTGFVLCVLCASVSGFASPARNGADEADEAKWINGIGMEFLRIPAGSFLMGCDPGFEECNDDEAPRCQVTISKPFYLGKTEVTQEQWTAVMENNPIRFKGRTHPVENVSWNDAQEFIRRLNRKEGTDKYRLPTEAEWEYAARAGTTSAYSFGNDASSLGQYAWYEDNSDKQTHPVGQKQPNAWGLYDMHGNLREWVEDWYDEDYYARSPGTDPKGPSTGSYRVLRGGSWRSLASFLRSASRNYFTPDFRYVSNGFRLAFSPGHPRGGKQSLRGMEREGASATARRGIPPETRR